MNELVFSVTQEEDGGFVTECLQEPIFTQGDTWEELRTAVADAVTAWHFDRPAPARVRLHLVREELLAVAWSSPVFCPPRSATWAILPRSVP